MAKRCRRSKKRDGRDNYNDPFSILPLDVMVEILLKLPAMSIARLNFVSKHWASIIIRSSFPKLLYMTRSLTRPRLLFVYNKKPSLFIESCSLEDPSSDHQRVSIVSHPDDYIHSYDFSAPICRLIGYHKSTRVKHWPGKDVLISYFGYDPVNDVYKVLCITVCKSRNVSDEHQVFTLGPKQKWRKIECKHPHLPDFEPKGICIDGVVYYYARIKKEGSLICFTSEDFNVDH